MEVLTSFLSQKSYICMLDFIFETKFERGLVVRVLSLRKIVIFLRKMILLHKNCFEIFLSSSLFSVFTSLVAILDK